MTMEAPDLDPLVEPWRVPRLTALPGCGGVLYSAATDFLVDEQLPYTPSGDGEHLFVRVEKRGIDTFEVTRRFAAVWGIKADDVGVAGLKDRWAVARQWISIPVVADVEARLGALDSDETLAILEVSRHTNKLRRGHVARNHFTVSLRNVGPEGLARARATLAMLKEIGVPNTFGRQRFGRDGDNALRGLTRLRQPKSRNRLGGLMISALQSAVFNRVLARRIDEGALRTALAGDVMQKHDTGGLFDVQSPADEQPRVDAVAISPTGPIVGKRMRAPSGVVAEQEAEALAACQLNHEDLPRFGRGTRRPLRIPCDPDAQVEAVDGTTLRVAFSLPSGSYATVLLDELVKPEDGMFTRSPSPGPDAPAT